jgi:hypothetical protein
MSVMSAKSDLLEAIATVDRGLGLSSQDGDLRRQAIWTAIERLERENPSPEPTRAGVLLDGDWQLLFTTSQELLGLDRFTFVDLGSIYQCIRTQRSKVYNIAEGTGIRFLHGVVCVSAKFVATSAERLEINFERIVVGPQGLLGYQGAQSFPDQMEQTPKFWLGLDFPAPQRPDRPGWIDVTYLDTEIRINRGSGGSVFVLKRV